MALYQLLRGRHVVFAEGEKTPVQTYHALKDNLIESNVDLVKKHGPTKFKLLTEDPRLSGPPKVDNAKTEARAIFLEMNEEELRKWAAEQEVELPEKGTFEQLVEVAVAAIDE